MDLTPLYILAALMQVEFFVVFITIAHPPVKGMLLAGMLGVLGVVAYLGMIPL